MRRPDDGQRTNARRFAQPVPKRRREGSGFDVKAPEKPPCNRRRAAAEPMIY
jgi:hypothetical protein